MLNWIGVAAYLVTAISARRTQRALGPIAIDGKRERNGWRFIAVVFVVLAVNRLLDIQLLLTQAGRITALAEGWYQYRAEPQIVLIALIAVFFVGVAIFSTIRMWRAPLPVRIALGGTAFLLGYVLVRAVSLHSIDGFIMGTILGLQWNWGLELGGVSIVFVASLYRHTQLARVGQGQTKPNIAPL
jgi:hypothetical protein